jgi:hypothetical protein
MFISFTMHTLILMLLFSMNSQSLVEVATVKFSAGLAATHHILAHPPDTTVSHVVRILNSTVSTRVA